MRGGSGDHDPTLDDEAVRRLLARARGGDRQALDELLTVARGHIHPLVRSAIATRPDLDVDEVVNAALDYVWRRIDVYDMARGSWRAFSRGLARTVVRRALTGRSDLVPGDEIDQWNPDPRWTEALSPRWRSLLGLDRVPHLGLVDPPHDFLALLELCVVKGGPPHQVLAFLWSRILFGQAKEDHGAGDRSRTPLWGDPDRVVREAFDLPLDALLQGFREEVLETLPVPGDDLDLALGPLAEALEKPTREVIPVRSRPKVASILDRRTGDTILRDYLGHGDPRRAVAQWSHDVPRRVRRHLGPELGARGGTRVDRPEPDAPDDSPRSEP
jgi:hypothetical protein